MWAVFLHDAYLAIGVPEGDEVFTQQLEANRGTAVLPDFAADEGGYPEPTHHVAERRAGVCPCNEVVFFPCQHGFSPLGCGDGPPVANNVCYSGSSSRHRLKLKAYIERATPKMAKV